MKLIYIILFFVSYSANATIYYVSNAGNNSNNGTSTSTTWQTIAKVNSFTLSPGDQVLFKKGDSWNESLNPTNSGSTGNTIKFGSYGTGAKPIITGFQTLTGWTNSGNIWSSTFSNSVHYQNTVLIGGELRAKGRTDWATIVSHSGKQQITGVLTGTPNYTGGEIVLRVNNWIINKGYIASQSGGTLNFITDTGYTITNGYGYFIQNIESVLDVQNEWCIDTTTKIIKVYSTSQPVAKASSIDTLVHVLNINYITFDGLSFEGANAAAFQIRNSDHVTIVNCDINNSGRNAIKANVSVDYLTVSKCTINHTYNDAIYANWNTLPAAGENDYFTLDSTSIKNTGTTAGMGESMDDAYFGISYYGDHSTITNNIIDTTGYNVIFWVGDSALIKNNKINYWAYVKQDAGAIYTFNGGSYNQTTGTIITGNIILNGVGTGAGTGAFGDYKGAVHAIYCDGYIAGVTIDSNTTYNNYQAGVIVNEGTNIKIRGNTFCNNVGTQLLLVNHNPNLIGGMYVTDNIFYSGLTIPNFNNYYLVDADFWYIPMSNFGTMDSNYYSHPPRETEVFRLYGVDYTLPQWITAWGKDTHSHGTPTGITSALPLFEYNASLSNRIVSLSGTYINAKGQSFTNSITIPPYRSEILFKAITDIYPPYTPTRKLKFNKLR